MNSILTVSSEKVDTLKANDARRSVVNLASHLRDNLVGVQAQATRLNEFLTNGTGGVSATDVQALFGEEVQAVKALASALSTLNTAQPGK